MADSFEQSYKPTSPINFGGISWLAHETSVSVFNQLTRMIVRKDFMDLL